MDSFTTAFKDTLFLSSFVEDKDASLLLMVELRDKDGKLVRTNLLGVWVDRRNGSESINIECSIPDGEQKGTHNCYWKEDNEGKLKIISWWLGGNHPFLLSREDLPEQIDVKGASQRLIDLAKEAEVWQGRFQNPDEEDYRAILRWVLTGELEPA